MWVNPFLLVKFPQLFYQSSRFPRFLRLACRFSCQIRICKSSRTTLEIGIAPEKSKLHPKQIAVLEKSQDPNINVMVLYGSTGCGKTNLGAEVVKIWMAQHFENNQIKVQKELNQDVSTVFPHIRPSLD